jgi:hypothetical protein
MILLGAHYIPFVFLYHFEFNSTSSRVKGANLESRGRSQFPILKGSVPRRQGLLHLSRNADL